MFVKELALGYGIGKGLTCRKRQVCVAVSLEDCVLGHLLPPPGLAGGS